VCKLYDIERNESRAVLFSSAYARITTEGVVYGMNDSDELNKKDSGTAIV
jgi:hypothetical protein